MVMSLIVIIIVILNFILLISIIIVSVIFIVFNIVIVTYFTSIRSTSLFDCKVKHGASLTVLVLAYVSPFCA